MCTLGRLIQSINCIFIFTILNFRLRGQQSLLITWTSKIKMAFSVKSPCFASNGQNNLGGKWCFVALRLLELDSNPDFVGFLLQMNPKTSLIDRCLSCILLLRSSTVSSVQALYAFQGIHSCLSPVEILDLKTPCPQISSSKIAPLPLEFWKAILGMVRIFSGIAQFNSKSK